MGFLKNLLGFESSFAKNITKDIWKDPTRLLTGIDPLSTKISNALTGQDNEALVNMWGTPEQQYLERARAEGIDTSDAEQMQGYAEKIAGMFAMNGLGNAAGNVMGSLGGGASNVAPSIGMNGGMAGGGAAAIGGGGAAASGGGGLLSSLGGVQGIASIGGGLLNAYSANKAQDAQAKAIADANAKGSAPGYALPYINEALGQAQTLAKKPYEAYTGKLVADQNPFEQQANQSVADWAKNGTAASNQATAGYSALAGGAKDAQAGFASMMNNPDRFNQGANFTSNAYADNHLGSLSQTSVGEAKFNDASNPFIGQSARGIQGADKVGGLLGANPYIGKSAGSVTAGKNALLGMNNPYLNEAIDYAQGDVTRNYERTTAPQQAMRMAASGSFGNTGLMAQDSEERRNLASELGRVSSGMRMQDYGLQAQLGEADVGRRLSADQFNVQSRANDIGRDMAGTFQQQGMGLDAEKFNASNDLTKQTFNANLGQTDLARNAQLAGQQGQFNSTGQANNSIFNTGAQNAANTWNAGAANSVSATNAGIQNDTNRFNVNNLNNSSNFNANAANQMRQFNSTQSANMYGQGVNGMMNSANQGLSGLMGVDGRQLQGGQALGLLGQNQRGIDQQGLTSAYDQWQRAQNYPQQQNQNYSDAIRQLSFGSAPQIPQQQVSPALQGLGAGLSIWGALKPSNTTSTAPASNTGNPVGGAANQYYDGYAWRQNGT